MRTTITPLPRTSMSMAEDCGGGDAALDAAGAWLSASAALSPSAEAGVWPRLRHWRNSAGERSGEVSASASAVDSTSASPRAMMPAEDSIASLSTAAAPNRHCLARLSPRRRANRGIACRSSAGCCQSAAAEHWPRSLWTQASALRPSSQPMPSASCSKATMTGAGNAARVACSATSAATACAVSASSESSGSPGRKPAISLRSTTAAWPRVASASRVSRRPPSSTACVASPAQRRTEATLSDSISTAMPGSAACGSPADFGSGCTVGCGSFCGRGSLPRRSTSGASACAMCCFSRLSDSRGLAAMSAASASATGMASSRSATGKVQPLSHSARPC